MTRSAHELHTEDVLIRCNDGFQMPALQITPRPSARRPGLLFVGEPFGLNGEMRRVSGEIARAGYIVLAPDLVSRGPWLRCVRSLMRTLHAGRGPGIDDLLAARTHLARHRDIEPERLAVMGLCMGGGFALLLAKTGLFRVCAPFYGQTPESMDGACPVVASFGGRDRMIRRHAAHLESELVRVGVAHDVKHYPEAGHSFLTRPPNRIMAAIGPLMPAHAGYSPDVAADAMERVLTFLERHI